LVNFTSFLIGGRAAFFEGLIEVLEVRHEWSFCSWAVRSKPAATGMPHSYLDPNRGSMQKPIEGGLQKTKQQNTATKNYRKHTPTQKTENTGCWVVGLGDNLRGRRESVLKSKSPNLSTQPGLHSSAFSPPYYKALKASNHLLYIDNMSSETLGFRSSNICLKSPIVKDLG
jgi:hypothetical protein